MRNFHEYLIKLVLNLSIGFPFLGGKFKIYRQNEEELLHSYIKQYFLYIFAIEYIYTRVKSNHI